MCGSNLGVFWSGPGSWGGRLDLGFNGLMDEWMNAGFEGLRV